MKDNWVAGYMYACRLEVENVWNKGKRRNFSFLFFKKKEKSFESRDYAQNKNATKRDAGEIEDDKSKEKEPTLEYHALGLSVGDKGSRV